MDYILEQKLKEMGFYNDSYVIEDLAWSEVSEKMDYVDNLSKAKGANIDGALILNDDKLYIAIKGIERSRPGQPLHIYALDNNTMSDERAAMLDLGSREWIQHIYEDNVLNNIVQRNEDDAAVTLINSTYTRVFYGKLMNKAYWNRPMKFYGLGREERHMTFADEGNMTKSVLNFPHLSRHMRVLCDKHGYMQVVVAEGNRYADNNDESSLEKLFRKYTDSKVGSRHYTFSLNGFGNEKLTFDLYGTQHDRSSFFRRPRKVFALNLDKKYEHQDGDHYQITWAKQTQLLWYGPSDNMNSFNYYKNIQDYHISSKKRRLNATNDDYANDFRNPHENSAYGVAQRQFFNGNKNAHYKYLDFVVKMPVGDSQVTFSYDEAPRIQVNHRMKEYDRKSGSPFMVFDPAYSSVDVGGSAVGYLDLNKYLMSNDDSAYNYLILASKKPIKHFISQDKAIVSSKEFSMDPITLPGVDLDKKLEGYHLYRLPMIAYQVIEAEGGWEADPVIQPIEEGKEHRHHEIRFCSSYSPLPEKWDNLEVLKQYYQNMKAVSVDQFGQVSSPIDIIGHEYTKGVQIFSEKVAGK